MQEWDRLVMTAIGLGAAIWTGIDGYRLWRKERYMAVAGVALLMIAAVAVPLILAMFAT